MIPSPYLLPGGILLFSIPLTWGVFSFDQSSLVLVDILPLSGGEWALSVCVDNVSLTFLSITLFVSGQVLHFSSIYIKGEPLEKGFRSIVLLFILSILLLSSSSSLLGLIIGWDGLGVSSLCLIVFYQGWNSESSGLQTFLTNRIGDILIIFSLSLLLLSEGSGDFLLPKGSEGLLLGVSAITKSAQFPFSSWLPRAMAAPTPVSALVHSSTLVTAGLFVVVRFSSLLPEEVSSFLFLSSSISIIFAGISALCIFDLKNIIAISTLSHISVMFFLVSVGSHDSAMVHIILHALFKSSLFIVAGWMIHSFGSEQDIRRISVVGLPPSLLISFIVSLSSSAGAPLFSGFFSNELCLASILPPLGSKGESIFLLSVFLTSSYSVRLLSFLISGSRRPSIMQSEGKVTSFFFSVAILSSLLSSGLIPLFYDSGSQTFLLSKMNIIIYAFSGVGLGVLLPLFGGGSLPPSLLLWGSSIWFFEVWNSFLSSLLLNSSFSFLSKIDMNGLLDSHFLSEGYFNWSEKELSLSISHLLSAMNVTILTSTPLLIWGGWSYSGSISSDISPCGGEEWNFPSEYLGSIPS